MNNPLAHLSVRQRIAIAAVVVLAGAGIWSLVRWQKEGDFRPLFTGLAPEDAAGIVQKLKEGGVEYRLPEAGGSVLVPSARLAELRLTLAAAGLPKTGRIGFELFDKANLGATEFSEHVNYRRALEGELERSVTSLAEVEAARVHLTFPKESVFLEAQQPAKASVLLKIRPGARLSQANVVAITHLVASAVEGLAPGAVSVLDMNGNLLGRPSPASTLDGPEPSEAALDYRHKVEADLVAKINSTLEPLLGAARFRAGASVECDFTGGEQSEEIYDPARSVMLSSQRSEDSSGTAGGAGMPGTASNLPRPPARAGGTSTRVSRMTENVTYQSSRTVKKTRMPAGAIRRMSLAVLVDQDVTWRGPQGSERVLVPPSPEMLKSIRELVAGVTGFNTGRGDQIVIETLPFETTRTLEPPVAGAPAPAPPAARWTLPWGPKPLLIGAGALVLLLLLLGFAATRRRHGRAPAAEVAGPPALPAGEQTAAVQTTAVQTADAQTAPEPGAPEIEDQLESKLAEREALRQKLDARALSAIQLAPVVSKAAEVLAKHLREKVSKDPEMSAQILRSWIGEEDN
jgi:flagellar M-ring protein FliF